MFYLSTLPLWVWVQLKGWGRQRDTKSDKAKEEKTTFVSQLNGDIRLT